MRCPVCSRRRRSASTLSVFELFVPLCSGGRIVLVENPLDFEGIANAPELRLINTVPSAVKALLEENAIPSSVRIVNLAGEPLPEALVRDIYLRTAAEAVYNLYGPSEDTTYSTVALIERDKPGAPSIGKAVSNGQVYVLDRFLEPAPVGVVGEVYCGGAGVTRGYWNRPDLTAERFIADPFLGVPGARLYRTGDLARWTEEGELEFFGRADFQVKVRGLRIELGEIQARLLDMDLLEEAVVTVRDDGRGDKQLLGARGSCRCDDAAVGAVQRLSQPSCRATAGLHDPGRLRGAQGAAADAERQDRPRGVAAAAGESRTRLCRTRVRSRIPVSRGYGRTCCNCRRPSA